MKMMSVALDSNSKDLDYSQLLAQNKALQSELIQCQADKDFVWSLWKRLQVSNPDVTDAISQVLQREKEKAEAKDHRVLEILQVKDDRIEELQNIVAKQAQEISDLLSRKVDLQEKCAQYQSHAEKLKDTVTPLEMKLKGFETKERSMDEAYRRTVEDSQREKHELQRRLTALSTELEVVREEKSSVADKRLELERTVRHLEKDVSEKISKFDGLIKELEENRVQAERAERRIQQLTQDVDFKNKELETIRKELKELWTNHNQLTEHSAQQAELIRQLQSLQHDTHIMIKNQEDAFSMEASSLQQMYTDITSRYEKAKQNEADLRQQILELKKDLMDRDDAVARLEGQAKILKEQLNNMNHEGSFLDLDLAAADRSTLEARRDLEALRQLEKTIGKLDQSVEHAGEHSIEFDVSHTQRSGRHSTPSRPESAVDRRLADTQRLLELKCGELEAIKKAHSRRLERLRAVQHSEKLLQEQLKVMEDTQTSRKKKKLQRSEPRFLQREDSDAVWNELAFFKSQNRSLEVERRNLQEELDELRVQASMDAATLHELRVNLQGQREEFEYQLKKREAACDSQVKMESDIAMLKSRLQNRDLHIGKLEKDLQELTMERDTLLEEKKSLKNQANELQQELSQSRIQLADLRHTVQRLQRMIEESAHAKSVGASEPRDITIVEETVDGEQLLSAPVAKRQARCRPSHKVRKPRRITSSAKQYQQVLNRSIEKMRSLFSSFCDDGWEEISEPGDMEDLGQDVEWEEDDNDDDDTEATGESLGVAIVHQACRASSADTSGFNKTSARQAKIGSWSKPHQGPVRGNSTKPAAKTASIRAASPGSGNKSGDDSPRVRARSPASSNRCRDHSPPVRDRVILRETATSPIPWGARPQPSSQSGSKQESRKNSQLLVVLRKRVAHLQQQVAVFKESRAAALKVLQDLRSANQQLSTDLAQANQRLRIAKQTCQRLSTDLERLQKEKQSGEQQLKSESAEVLEKQEDCDKRLLEAKLKMANSEVARQASTVRSLKTEADSLHDQIRGLQDRVNHLERDNNQKRALVESQRIKLKALQDASKADEDAMEELQTKLKLTSESTEKMRIQLESLKKRMRVVSQEKRDYEDKHLQVALRLEKKAKELSACRERCSALETALAQLEDLNQQQLQRLANHSEAAVDAAQAQVSATHRTLSRYQQLVRVLAKELLERVKQARARLREVTAAREEQALDSDVSLKRARDTARDILNISQSDLDDIMSADGDHDLQVVSPAAEEKKDRKWMRRCDKMIGGKDDFVQPLVSLLLQKVDERVDLMLATTS